MIQMVQATTRAEMALYVLLGRHASWEDIFTKKFGVRVTNEVGLTKMVGALCVMTQRDLDVEVLNFITTVLPPQPPPVASQEQ